MLNCRGRKAPVRLVGGSTLLNSVGAPIVGRLGWCDSLRLAEKFVEKLARLRALGAGSRLLRNHWDERWEFLVLGRGSSGSKVGRVGGGCGSGCS